MTLLFDLHRDREPWCCHLFLTSLLESTAGSETFSQVLKHSPPALLDKLSQLPFSRPVDHYCSCVFAWAWFYVASRFMRGVFIISEFNENPWPAVESRAVIYCLPGLTWQIKLSKYAIYPQELLYLQIKADWTVMHYEWASPYHLSTMLNKAKCNSQNTRSLKTRSLHNLMCARSPTAASICQLLLLPWLELGQHQT